VVTDKLRGLAAALKGRNGSRIAYYVRSHSPFPETTFPASPDPSFNAQLALCSFPPSASPMQYLVQLSWAHKSQSSFPVRERFDESKEGLGIRRHRGILEESCRNAHHKSQIAMSGHLCLSRGSCRFGLLSRQADSSIRIWLS